MKKTIKMNQGKTKRYLRTISEKGKENLYWTWTQTRDLWITVSVLSHLSYPALWMVAVLNSQLVFAGLGAPVRSMETINWQLSPGITALFHSDACRKDCCQPVYSSSGITQSECRVQMNQREKKKRLGTLWISLKNGKENSDWTRLGPETPAIIATCSHFPKEMDTNRSETFQLTSKSS